MRGHSAWPRLAETQPITFAGAGAPPALLLHGADDERVRPRNSQRLKAALDRAGTRAVLKLYPAMTHAGIINPVIAAHIARADELAGVSLAAGQPAAKLVSLAGG